jgi:integrase
MPPARLIHLRHELTRHGKRVWVVRVGWTSLRSSTQRNRERIMRVVIERAGNQPLEAITRKLIVASRDARSSTPGAARNFLNTMRALYAWALDAGHVETDPTVGVKPPKQNTEGLHTWSPDELARFESHWPLGTRERLAFDIMLWTGLRLGDAIRLGPQHVRDGLITIETEKTRREVIMPMLDPLAKNIDAVFSQLEKKPTTYITTLDGRPVSKTHFGHLFKKVCEAAGCPGRAHGLRKALAVRLAESGAGPLEIGSILGNSMGEFYSRKANRERLATAAMEKLSPARAGKGVLTD